MKNLKLKCYCCSDWLEITEGEGQVHIQIHIGKWRLWSRIKHAIGCIFNPKVYKDGGIIWTTPTRWKNFKKKLSP